MKLGKVRLILFCVWAGFFFVYVAAMWLTSLKRGVTPQQATEAAWSVAYILLPILTAFLSLFLAPKVAGKNSRAAKLDRMEVDSSPLWAMAVATTLFHALILLYFGLFLFAPDWADEGRQTRSFDETLAMGLKMLTLLSALAVAPVGWVLNPESPAPPSIQPAPTSPSTRRGDSVGENDAQPG